MYDLIVVGGGASGMMAAGRAAERGLRVLLLEKNKRLGEKLRITGGGRCNVTNAEENERLLLKSYGKAEQFLYSVFAQYGVTDTFRFFQSRALPLKVEERKRAFPITEKAEDVVHVLEEYIKKHGVEVVLGAKVSKVVTHDGRITGIESKGQIFMSQDYLVATGGMSHPETGSTGDGFRWLKELGHTVAQPTPTIVPLKVKDAWIKALAGSTLENVKMTVFSEGKKQFRLDGTILCTHFGVSGPLVLNNAHKVADLLQSGAVTATIDLIPGLDHGALEKQILEIFDEHKNKSLRNVLPYFVPTGTVKGVCILLENSVDTDTKVHSVSKIDRKQIVSYLKAMPLTIQGLMGFDRAVVADGGVPLTEIDMRTMRSKVVPNLLVTGDLLHITRPSGGFSLQLCWSTGFVAGSSAEKSVI